MTDHKITQQNPYDVYPVESHLPATINKPPSLFAILPMVAWIAFGTYCPYTQLGWAMNEEPFLIFEWKEALYSAHGILIAFGWLIWSSCIVRWVLRNRIDARCLILLLLPALFLPMSIFATYLYFVDIRIWE